MANVRIVTTRGVTAGLLVMALTASACGSGGASTEATRVAERTTTTSTTTVPERPTSTTTTIYDPATVEGQVEAAYLKSWDVYAEAVYNLELDEKALAEVYAEPLLGVRHDEIAARVLDRRASLVRVAHDYSIERTGVDTAAVVDRYVNHQVLIDAATKEPIEADPNKTIIDAFTLRRVAGRWVVFDQRRIQ